MAKNIEVGKRGEEIAKDLLVSKGYEILEKNPKNKYGEIDIVARNNREFIFVEVRTKTGKMFGSPEETIKYRKKRKLINNAKSYINLNGIKNPYRIDAICIVLNRNKEVERATHYENITLF